MRPKKTKRKIAKKKTDVVNVKFAKIMWFPCNDCGKTQLVTTEDGMEALNAVLDKKIDRAIKRALKLG